MEGRAQPPGKLKQWGKKWGILKGGEGESWRRKDGESETQEQSKN
jgi:hypothetical protein